MLMSGVGKTQRVYADDALRGNSLSREGGKVRAERERLQLQRKVKKRPSPEKDQSGDEGPLRPSYRGLLPKPREVQGERARVFRNQKRTEFN